MHVRVKRLLASRWRFRRCVCARPLHVHAFLVCQPRPLYMYRVTRCMTLRMLPRCRRSRVLWSAPMRLAACDEACDEACSPMRIHEPCADHVLYRIPRCMQLRCAHRDGQEVCYEEVRATRPRRHEKSSPQQYAMGVPRDSAPARGVYMPLAKLVGPACAKPLVKKK